MYTLFSGMAPKKNSTEHLRLINLGVTVDGDGRTAKAQAGYQIAGLAVALGIAIIGGIVTGNELFSFFFISKKKVNSKVIDFLNDIEDRTPSQKGTAL